MESILQDGTIPGLEAINYTSDAVSVFADGSVLNGPEAISKYFQPFQCFSSCLIWISLTFAS